MKIGVLTQPLGHNYGGILQNWALQQVLIRLGHKPVTLIYRGRSHIDLLWFNTRAVLSYIIKHIIFHPTRSFNKLPWNHRPYTELRRFCREQIESTPYIPTFSSQSMRGLGIDAIITGSDQVWRPRYNRGRLPLMFCSFLDNDDDMPRMAYAASFGTSEWEFDINQTQMARQALKRFRTITVREDSGVILCRKHLDSEATHVLDPTLLLAPDDYNLLIEPSHSRVIPHGTIGVYILDLTEEKKTIVAEIAATLNKTPYYFPYSTNQNIDNPPVQQWLAMFKICDFIITDSFHGSAFSINYHKPFISIINHDRGADRFTSLLRSTCLEKRQVEVTDLAVATQIATQPINWDDVEKRLYSLRNHSVYYLNTLHTKVL